MIRITPAHAARVAWQRFFGVIALTVFCAVASGNAFAEKADRDKPINLVADRVTVDDANQISTFEGRVVLTQGTLIIRGVRMQIRQDDQGFKHGTTWGDLSYFRQKREGFDEYIEGWAERIEYDGRADTVQLFVRASMKKGGDEVRGNYISYDANSEFFQVIGGGAQAKGSADGRVRAVIQPKPKEPAAAQPARPPVPLKPTTILSAPREELRAPQR